MERRADSLGAPFVLIQRMPGIVLLDAMVSPRMLTLARLLGRAQVPLHGLDAREFRRLLDGARNRAISIRSILTDASSVERTSARRVQAKLELRVAELGFVERSADRAIVERDGDLTEAESL